MSTTSTFALGLGGGAALWYLTKNKRPHAPTAPTTPQRNAGTTHIPPLSSTFTFVVYPEGIWGTTKRVRYFKAAPPTTWEDARDRLIAAKLLDRNALSPNGAGAWRLVTDPARFRADRAEPLPGSHRDSGRTKKRYSLEGRRILRDGEAIASIDRVDLGDQRYALSPHETDRLAERLVQLLNRHGAR